MCGVIGISLKDSNQGTASHLLEAAVALQHRGQDACGIVVGDPQEAPVIHKGFGLVSEVFKEVPSSLAKSTGRLGLAHVRYPTNGNLSEDQIQPLLREEFGGAALVHNGHLVDVKYASTLQKPSSGHSAEDLTDSLLMLEIFVSTALSEALDTSSVDGIKRLVAGVEEIYRICIGSFACVVLVPSFGIFAFRDAHGIKPLVFGQRQALDGQLDFMFASESTALRKLGFTSFRDVLPGEAIFCPNQPSSFAPSFWCQQITPRRGYTPDIFEYVYFARPDSIIDGIEVSKSRQAMGVKLAEELTRQLGPTGTNDLIDIDCIIPVPETSYITAATVSQILQKPFVFGFVQNKYIQRSFIAPDQAKRLKIVVRKFSTVRQAFDGRNVLVIDDSIVRGTTSVAIVKLALESGASKIHIASASPEVRFNHVHGIALADQRQLVAHLCSNEDVRAKLGCNSLVYLPVNKLIEACTRAGTGTQITGFEIGLFTGKYVTDDRIADFDASEQQEYRATTVLKCETLDPQSWRTHFSRPAVAA